MPLRITPKERIELIKKAIESSENSPNSDYVELLNYIRNISSMPEGWVKVNCKKGEENG